MTEQADKYRQAAQQMERLAELDEEEAEVKESVERELDTELKGMLTHVMSEHEEITKLSIERNINATEARKQLNSFPSEYIVQEQTIPDLVKKMRKARRELKGEQREKMSKAIDTMINAYADHLQKCIKSISWLSPYTPALLQMRFNEKDLHKLHKMKDAELRRETVDALCKYWELDLEQQGMAYSQEYSQIHKEMRSAKKSFRDALAKITDQSITKTKKQRQEDFILKAVCENQGIGAREIHEKMPTPLFKISSPNMISKMVKKLDIVSSNGAYYKMPSMMKKNIWAYCAAFIDSDGYITLDRNMNPRVGLVATGTRGRAFMEEMHKSIGFGRMHLDQKSPQDTRLINRLNFYSQDDVTKLLTKCLPHFRLKKGNAELLLELIRMKKSYKKADWYKSRCDEIFKLMKWENHKDHVGFDWLKEGIYLDDIQKFKDNCKMSVMDELENIGGIIAKADNLEEMFNELKIAARKGRTEDKNFDGKRWWNQQIPKIEEKFGKEELDYTWNTPIIDKEVNLDDKSDDFDGDKAKPSHFYNQLVRIPQRKKFTPEAIMQIAINIGFGQAVGSVDGDYTIDDFIAERIEKEDTEEMERKGLSWFAKGNNPKKFLLDKDGVRHAAGVAVYKGDKILIVERSPEEDTMIGLWEFAGGKIEELDEFNEDGTPDAEKVCMIEAGEELGLFKKPSSKVGVHFDKNMTPPKKYHCFRVDVEEEWNPTLSFEHSDYKWITIEELKAYPDNQMSHHVRFLASKL